MYTFINMCTIKFGLYCYITLKNSILMYTALFYYLHSNAVRLPSPPHFFFAPLSRLFICNHLNISTFNNFSAGWRHNDMII